MTMQRRKMLAALGSVAVGGATAVSTGAFTSVEAQRSVNVSVADDSEALLAFDTADSGDNSQYADVSGDAISVDLTQLSDAAGVNANSTTTILDIFRIRNQGTQPVFVYVDPESGVSPDSVTVETPGEGVSRTFPKPGENDEVYVDPQASALPDRESGGNFARAPAYSLTGVYGSTDYTQRPSDGNFDPRDLTLGVGQDIAFGLNVQHSGNAGFPDDIAVTIQADADLAVVGGS